MWFAQCPGNSLALTVARYFWVFSDYTTALCRPTLLREPLKLGSSTPASSVSLSVHGINVWNGKGEGLSGERRGLAAITRWASWLVYGAGALKMFSQPRRGKVEDAGLPAHYVTCVDALIGIGIMSTYVGNRRVN